MNTYRRLAVTLFLVTFAVAWLRAEDKGAFQSHDPGPRANPSTAIPSPVQGLNENETALFNESLLRVSELEGSCDTCVQQPPNQPPIDPDPNNPFSPSGLV